MRRATCQGCWRLAYSTGAFASIAFRQCCSLHLAIINVRVLTVLLRFMCVHSTEPPLSEHRWHLKLAKQLMHSCWQLYDGVESQLAAEVYTFRGANDPAPLEDVRDNWNGSYEVANLVAVCRCPRYIPD